MVLKKQAQNHKENIDCSDSGFTAFLECCSELILLDRELNAFNLSKSTNHKCIRNGIISTDDHPYTLAFTILEHSNWIAYSYKYVQFLEGFVGTTSRNQRGCKATQSTLEFPALSLYLLAALSKDWQELTEKYPSFLSLQAEQL